MSTTHPTPPSTFTFVLIHGAWHGGWCWHKLIPLLTMGGHRVIAPDLPGLGQDQTPLAEITLASYVNRILEVLDQANEPVVLVGHSLGGLTITQVAEERPERIRWLVYLSAVLPRSGETATSLLLANSEQARLLETLAESDAETIRLRFDAAAPFFYHDCSPADTLIAQRLLRPQTMRPLTEPVRLSERFARVPRAYLTCTQDRVMSPALQARMEHATPCQQVIALSSGHSAFWSVPSTLAARLEAIARTEPGEPGRITPSALESVPEPLAPAR